jgi:hypothetical protein
VLIEVDIDSRKSCCRLIAVNIMIITSQLQGGCENAHSQELKPVGELDFHK